MIIRPAKQDDIIEIGQMWIELIAYHRELDPDMPAPVSDGAQRYAERMRYGLDDSYFRICVAQEDDTLLGYVFGTIIDLLPETFQAERAGMIGDIFVRSSYRHRGVGQALMAAMKDWFRLRGVSHYEWYVASANEPAIHFWRETMGGKAVMIRMRAPIDDV